MGDPTAVVVIQRQSWGDLELLGVATSMADAEHTVAVLRAVWAREQLVEARSAARRGEFTRSAPAVTDREAHAAAFVAWREAVCPVEQAVVAAMDIAPAAAHDGPQFVLTTVPCNNLTDALVRSGAWR